MTEPNAELVESIEKRYVDLQSQFVVEQGPPGLAEAVTFSSNQSTPVHRWFVFKEAFGTRLFDFLSLDFPRMQRRDSIFMDPFCGSGTTILSADLQYGWACERIGVETNPFIAFVANTKANWRKYDPSIVEKYARAMLATPLRQDIAEAEWPELSTFKNREMFDRSRVSSLIDAVRRSRNIPAPYDDLFLLGSASVVERLSLYRKTGRALRKIRGSKNLESRQGGNTEREFLNVMLSFANDMRQLSHLRERESTDFKIIRADGRTLQAPEIQSGSVSLMVYSPPYLNQIDYTEVYKVESWLLGFFDSASAMKTQRLATLRSHSSVKFPESRPDLTPDAEVAMDHINNVVGGSGDSWHRMFPRTAYGYLSDMQQSLRRQYDLLEPGAQIRCVIGNSAYGAKGKRIAVATDLFLADIARAVGFEVPKIQVARMLPRRDHLNLYLRESVVWMRKPDAR